MLERGLVNPLNNSSRPGFGLESSHIQILSLGVSLADGQDAKILSMTLDKAKCCLLLSSFGYSTFSHSLLISIEISMMGNARSAQLMYVLVVAKFGSSLCPLP